MHDGARTHARPDASMSAAACTAGTQPQAHAGTPRGRGARTALPGWLTMALRIVGAIVGSYALVALAVASCSAALAHAGMARAEAVALCAMLGFVLYLVLALWAFSVRSVARLWLVLAVAAALLASLRQAVA